MPRRQPQPRLRPIRSCWFWCVTSVTWSHCRDVLLQWNPARDSLVDSRASLQFGQRGLLECASPYSPIPQGALATEGTELQLARLRHDADVGLRLFPAPEDLSRLIVRHRSRDDDVLTLFPIDRS